MLYALAVVAGIILGLIASRWAVKLPDPPLPNHEYCSDRYNAMRERYLTIIDAKNTELRGKESEIQSLVRGIA
jgi:hypothetical protein